MTDDQVLKAIRVINERVDEQNISYDEVRRCYASLLIKLINAQMVQALPSDGLETIEIKGTDPFNFLNRYGPAIGDRLIYGEAL